jgi:hypothetical protein
LTRHFRGGFALLGAYTWSKAITLTESAIDSEAVADTFNRSLGRSIAVFNYPHFVKATWIYDAPIGRGKLIPLHGIVNTVFGGWQVTGNHQIRSGDALSISTGGLQSPVGVVRPDLVLGQPIVIHSDAPINFRGFEGGTAYLNRDAFANPPVFPGGQNVIQRLGTLAPVLPNTRGPHFTYEDIGIQKTFLFTEHRSFELRGTFLNPFNRHGRGNPITDLTDPNFGQITGQQIGGRNIELAARITF